GSAWTRPCWPTGPGNRPRPGRGIAAPGAGRPAREPEDELVQPQHSTLGRDQVPVAILQQPALQVRLRIPRVHPARGHAPKGPEPEQQLLEVRVERIKPLLPADRSAAGLDELQVLLGRANVPPPAVAPERVRAGPQARVGPPLPVAEVVDARKPRPCPVRDLVVLVAGRRER